MNKRFSQIEKITLSSMLLAISIVLGTITKMISIPHLSFISFSFTPSIVIFASLALGPIYGAVVGGLADLLPAFIYPTGAYNFILTLVYVALGIMPWLLEKITRKINRSFPFTYVVIGLIVLLFGAEIYIFYGTNVLDVRLSYFGPYVKLIILSLSFLMDTITAFGLMFMDRYYAKKKDVFANLPKPGEIAFISFFCQIALLVFFKGLAYYLYFIVISSTTYRVAYEVIVAMLCISAPIDVLLIDVIVPWMLAFISTHKSQK